MDRCPALRSVLVLIFSGRSAVACRGNHVEPHENPGVGAETVMGGVSRVGSPEQAVPKVEAREVVIAGISRRERGGCVAVKDHFCPA